MIVMCNNLVKENDKDYLNYLKEEIRFVRFEENISYISFPFLDHKNDYICLYIEKINNTYFIRNDSFDLELYEGSFNYVKQYLYCKSHIELFYENDILEIKTEESKLNRNITMFLQMLIVLNNFIEDYNL